jgi:2,6-dihydroxypyridine 3-monooxygenase
LGEAIVASGGDVPRALAEWEPSQIELGRRALERARRVGARVQIDGTYRPGDPEMAFGLFAPGDQNFPRLEPATGGRA